MSADFAHTLGAITPEYAEAAGGEVHAFVDRSQFGYDCACGWSGMYSREVHFDTAAEQQRDHATRQAAADTVLTAARRLCCGEHPAPHHAATHDHSQRMAFAEELARAVRRS